MKVSELSGALLNYWTGRAERASFVGRIAEYTDGKTCCVVPAGVCGENGWTDQRIYSPSSDWSIGGPIIEREGLTVRTSVEPRTCLADDHNWRSCYHVGQHMAYGRTPLEAAMRSYVASKFGTDVPDEVPA